MGGGAELSTACDHRVMATDASIHWVHIRMGVSPGWGGGYRLVNLVGRQKALKILAGSTPLSAHEALDIGYVDQLAPPTKAFEVICGL
jgi:ethylmalonyl-CoA/methylmalonyl-CoA decarboxylase